MVDLSSPIIDWCLFTQSGSNGGDGSNCSTPTTLGGTIEEAATSATDAALVELGTSPGNQPGSWPNLQVCS
jgi:hypothetical protein